MTSPLQKGLSNYPLEHTELFDGLAERDNMEHRCLLLTGIVTAIRMPPESFKEALSIKHVVNTVMDNHGILNDVTIATSDMITLFGQLYVDIPRDDPLITTPRFKIIKCTSADFLVEYDIPEDTNNDISNRVCQSGSTL